MKTRTADIYLSPDGLVLVRVDRDAKQDLTEAKENLAASISVREGLKRPLLTDIRFCLPLTPEARRYYSGQVLVDSFLAMGILIDASAFGTMMGNIYIQIAKPGIPTRLFTDEERAIEWLKEFVRD